MKTLDEVIENIIKQSGLEIRNVRKPDRDRFWVDRDTYNDTLQYLRKYREIEDEYNELKDWWAEEYVTNDPLTWDELKGMEGKPVWVEYESCNRKVWAIIDCFYTDAFLKVIMNVALPHDYWNLEKEMMGKTWQAYRKERLATGGSLTAEPKSKKIGDYTEIKWKEKK